MRRRGRRNGENERKTDELRTQIGKPLMEKADRRKVNEIGRYLENKITINERINPLTAKCRSTPFESSWLM